MPMTEEHPRRCRHAAGRKHLAALGRATILPVANLKDGRQKATQRAPDAGMPSSLHGFSACSRPGRPSVQPEPPTYRRHGLGDDGMQFRPCAQNPRRGGCDDREGRSLSPEASGPKAFGCTVRNVHFPRRFWAPSNIAKYNGKINPSVWLEDYRLMCRV
jgi:hypothetical protein